MLFLGCQLLTFCAVKESAPEKRPVYQDESYLQDYSVKYYTSDDQIKLLKVSSDRNGVIKILSSQGLMQPHMGQFLYPGKVVRDVSYRPMANKKISDLEVYKNQFVYIDDQAVFSNAWAGTLFSKHTLPGACIFAGGKDFNFLVSDGRSLKYIKNSAVSWEGDISEDSVIDIKYDPKHGVFRILGKSALYAFSPDNKKLETSYHGDDLTCFEITDKSLVLGTHDGYLEIDPSSGKPIGTIQQKLPWTNLTAIKNIDGKLWFGSTRGAFMLRDEGNFNYYASERWLPDDVVTDIAPGKDQQILILTNKGLGIIRFKEMTLYDKAMLYEKQVRLRHIRYGFNCDVSPIKHGDLSTLELRQADSDNLWTAMYLASQLFRYQVTKSPDAYQNFLESFDAMERLFTITGIPGLFGRGFERRGYFKHGTEPSDEGYSNGWTPAKDPEWDWRGSSSSDQTVGQMFALTLTAELAKDESVKQRAIHLMDQLMIYIIKNDWYIIDFDGKPTLWGKWNPDYVNGFPPVVGDRKLYASNIIAFLQAAYHFTGKAIYKDKAYELMNKYGYLDNLMRPISEIGQAPDSSDEWAKMLSEGWNHSDDEMYFLAYWDLYPYAFNDSLKVKYAAAIKDHWEAERPEVEGLWNFCYAMTGATEFDLDKSIWYLKEFPLDMIQWNIKNSDRKDLEFLEPNFRGQPTAEVLPPDERPELKHNKNQFNLDRLDSNGDSELSAGDSFLLPYWMGRYLGIISAPPKKGQEQNLGE